MMNPMHPRRNNNSVNEFFKFERKPPVAMVKKGCTFKKNFIDEDEHWGGTDNKNSMNQCAGSTAPFLLRFWHLHSFVRLCFFLRFLLRFRWDMEISIDQCYIVLWFARN
jgi:hypothetical protein